MSKLREQMKYDMNLMAFSEKTKIAYLKHVELFAKYFKKSPEKLGEEMALHEIQHSSNCKHIRRFTS